MAAPRRTHLGTQTALSHVRRVYRTADAIEVDEIEGTDVTRRWVLLDEVLLITLLRAHGLAFVLTRRPPARGFRGERISGQPRILVELCARR